MAISVAFFGLGIGSFLVHLLKNRLQGSEEQKQRVLLSKTVHSVIAFAISLPIFVIVMGHVPSDISYIYLYYLASSIPFFFAGISMALIFFAMPKEINRLYFADLAGAALATLLLDPLMQGFGAESVLVLIAIIVLGPTALGYLALMKVKGPSDYRYSNLGDGAYLANTKVSARNIKISSATVTIGCAVLLIFNSVFPPLLAIPPGETKGLHQRLADQPVELLSTRWNSFSRVDVTRPNYNIDNVPGPAEAGTIIIDADAVTPVLRWNGSISDSRWVSNYMDYLPYQLQRNTNKTLVIGSGGGEDILVGLSAGAENVTAVELNPLIVSATRAFGNISGNLYSRDDVKLVIDDGRRFIGSTDEKYDIITIKLVDSWAAQLAGGYALSENYLYTVEAFEQYFSHLDGDEGILVMVRWNTELPRLMPLVFESLRQMGKTDEEISKQVMVVEDKPGLYFGSDPAGELYPVLVMVKSSPYTDAQVELVKSKAQTNGAEIFALPGSFMMSPYDLLLPELTHSDSIGKTPRDKNYQSALSIIQSMTPPTDDSPFYFAKEHVPKQMITLLITVLAISGGLAILLIIYARKSRARRNSTSLFHLIFAICIGLGFMFLEITFIQEFLLLLGTPIMALTVILFSILLSSGIGAYLSGKIFKKSASRSIVLDSYFGRNHIALLCRSWGIDLLIYYSAALSRSCVDVWSSLSCWNANGISVSFCHQNVCESL